MLTLSVIFLPKISKFVYMCQSYSKLNVVRFWDAVYTVSQKGSDYKLAHIRLPNVDWFSKFFHRQIHTVSHSVGLLLRPLSMSFRQWNDNANIAAKESFQQLFWVAESCMAAFFTQFFEHGNFLNIDISQGSVPTCLRCGGIFNSDYFTLIYPKESVSERVLKIGRHCTKL